MTIITDKTIIIISNCNICIIHNIRVYFNSFIQICSVVCIVRYYIIIIIIVLDDIGNVKNNFNYTFYLKKILINHTQINN